MAILERITRNIDNRYWDPGVSSFPVRNRYTAGVAGQKFFEELKENEIIMGSTCKTCDITYVPARLYCERCFARLDEKAWIDVGTSGTIYAFTKVYKDKSGEEKVEPTILVAVKIADGLIIHRLGECAYDDLYIGMPVVAEFKPKPDRQGGIEDISYFKPQ